VIDLLNHFGISSRSHSIQAFSLFLSSINLDILSPLYFNMSSEKPCRTSSSSDEPGSATKPEVNSSKRLSGEQEKSAQNLGWTIRQNVSNLDYDHRDTNLDQWSFDKHLHAIVNDLREHKLPPISSGSSVIWRDLQVRGEGAGVTYQQTIGEILRGPVTGIQKLTFHRKPPERVILHNIEGVVREGEMLLVLGRPGSGCSTFLKSLCGLTDEYLGWQGEVRYNGVDIDTVKSQFRGDVVYTSEGKTPRSGGHSIC
jgi:ABC-type multidrug transport system fused ATPase/permease subunit